MITTETIQSAIQAALQAQFPQEPVYENLVPRNGQRPCNMVHLCSIAPGSVSHNGFELLFTYLITDLVEVDERMHSHLPALDLRTLSIISLFACGYLTVGDRALKIRSCTRSHNYDYTETTVVLSLYYARSDLTPESIKPMMEQLTITSKLKEDIQP